MSKFSLASACVLPTPENGGEVYSAPYPFVMVPTIEWSHELNHELPGEPSWRPGVEFPERGESEAWADGMGEVILTVVSRHKPSPKHQERVFYTRKWRDPEGREFGNNKLHVATAQAFGRRKRGWWVSHAFDLTGKFEPNV